ncbi:response regulator [Pseudobacteroides cellulosolvens]|uniref:Stage 0 sporulation protein A homolog n=1 Tax=Pseudobacteroides cellulosolvens ATCC 35603 = DSM 2933 TaxID=398512 RepID=A0A0L6JMP8_9FIRM|nr:response regulator transcription factor [Pseudobacteroides cellulosolvens]KNY27033.1 two component transcriptional regulator, LuxR family [Pseudobacteroides cellulosolvens ATCC 35603 = DSM 2933]
MIKVLLVDDQLIMREGIKIILEQDKDIKVVGCAENGKTALKLCERLSPDVVLMDVLMPDCDGVEGTRLIKTKFKNTKVVMLTTFNDDENISNALNYGADGYILKEIKPDDLILTVKSAAAGLSIMHKDTYKNVVKKVNSQNKISIIENRDLKVNLSERELSIIRLIVDGKTNIEISNSINLTEGTVRNVISGILKKLNLKDRTQLAILAVKSDLV